MEDIEVHLFADEHLGDSAVDYKRLLERIKYVEETPNAFCLFGGDLMNTALKNSVSNVYGEIPPMEQLRECVNLFGGVAKKTLGVVGGNHEARITRDTSVDMTEIFCQQLGIVDKYSPDTAVVCIRFGKNDHNRNMFYSLYLCHGSGGGRKIGAKMARLEDLAGIIDTDIYVMNHTHSPAVFRQRFVRVDARNNALNYVEHLFVNSASNLEHSGSYGDAMGFKPTSKISPIIHLSASRRYMWAEL